MISAVMALMAMAIDLMLPAFDDIRVAFDLPEDSNETGKIITVFFFGLAVSQLAYGPLADRYGRKPVLYAGMSIYVLGAIGSALAPTFAWLLVSRFVWGVGAAGARVVATAVIRDNFEGNAMAKAMSQIMAVFVLVPVFAPGLGAGLIAFLPWRALFWFCVVWTVGVGLWSLRLRETLLPEHRQPISLSAAARGYARVARTPVTAGYTVATIFLQGVMTAYLASSELIIGNIFDREAEFPIIFGAVAVLFGVAAVVNGRIVERLGIDAVVRGCLAASLALSAALIAIAVAGAGQPSIWLFMPILGLLLSSFMFLMPNLNSAALAPVGEIAGTASAVTGAVRLAGGAVLGTIVSGLVEDSVTPFSIGIALMCLGAAGCVFVVRRGTLARMVLDAEPVRA